MAALALQLEELDCLTRTDKGKYAADSPPDSQMALLTFQEEMMQHLSFLNDVKIAHSFARAVDEDGPVIEELSRGDHQIVDDRQYAMRISGSDRELENPPAAAPLNLLAIDDGRSEYTDLLDRFLDEKEEGMAGPSVSYTERQKLVLEGLPFNKCVVCLDQFLVHEVLRLECKHVYCYGCMKQLFMRSTKDEGLFPPRCCKLPTPLILISGAFREQERAAFELATVEFSATNRTYCHVSACATFLLPSETEGTRAKCGQCSEFTCIICKSFFHEGECDKDSEFLATLSLGVTEGWQRCQKCGLMFDLFTGCFHMRCNCGHEVCFLCNMPWKTCDCREADEERLNAGGFLPVAERNRRVNQIRDVIRENHGCEHSRRFERVTYGAGRRGFRCEMCPARHWKYILRCRRCEVQVCEDCRRNRI
ncbi:hypothetical protein EJ08DRAFT_672707 [Tothia fuscella]|uniref:RING-type domain-containing protein n=1 Tax=Tothia fuscella TaxID=1048955 RepID=A0A9P4NIG3_9PEZI|nr:hypothetical protein EJ08DRAFT_672707 [Tothia fuscella]